MSIGWINNEPTIVYLATETECTSDGDLLICLRRLDDGWLDTTDLKEGTYIYRSKVSFSDGIKIHCYSSNGT